jgi:hypothetical protein
VSVSFSPETALQSLPDGCFDDCSALVEIVLPSAVDRIGGQCFSGCRALKGFNVPSAVETISWNCFSDCRRLVSVTFPPDSKLSRIEAAAFQNCAQLRELTVPSSVKCIEQHCFQKCDQLSCFVIASPSLLRDLLDLPPAPHGPLEIPDSVEILLLPRRTVAASGHVLEFGPESRLRQLDIAHSLLFMPKAPRCFVRAASRSLKRFRERLEFQSDKGSLSMSPFWTA